MGVRRQRGRLAQRRVPGYHMTGLSDQHIAGRCPLPEERRIGRWRRSRRNASGPRGRINVPELWFVFEPSLPDSRHHTRMDQAERSRRQQSANSEGPADLPAPVPSPGVSWPTYLLSLSSAMSRLAQVCGPQTPSM